MPLALVLRIQHRDGYACVYCGDAATRLHVDHVRPCAHFPATIPDPAVNAPINLVTACCTCNGSKGMQDLPCFATMLRRRGVPAAEVRAMISRARRAVRRPL